MKGRKSLGTSTKDSIFVHNTDSEDNASAGSPMVTSEDDKEPPLVEQLRNLIVRSKSSSTPHANSPLSTSSAGQTSRAGSSRAVGKHKDVKKRSSTGSTESSGPSSRGAQTRKTKRNDEAAQNVMEILDSSDEDVAMSSSHRTSLERSVPAGLTVRAGTEKRPSPLPHAASQVSKPAVAAAGSAFVPLDIQPLLGNMGSSAGTSGSAFVPLDIQPLLGNTGSSAGTSKFAREKPSMSSNRVSSVEVPQEKAGFGFGHEPHRGLQQQLGPQKNPRAGGPSAEPLALNPRAGPSRMQDMANKPVQPHLPVPSATNQSLGDAMRTIQHSEPGRKTSSFEVIINSRKPPSQDASASIPKPSSSGIPALPPPAGASSNLIRLPQTTESALTRQSSSSHATLTSEDPLDLISSGSSSGDPLSSRDASEDSEMLFPDLNPESAIAANALGRDTSSVPRVSSQSIKDASPNQVEALVSLTAEGVVQVDLDVTRSRVGILSPSASGSRYVDGRRKKISGAALPSESADVNMEDSTGSSSKSSFTPSRGARGRARSPNFEIVIPLRKRRLENLTRKEWRALVASDGYTQDEIERAERELRPRSSTRTSSTRPSSSVEGIDFTITDSFVIGGASNPITILDTPPTSPSSSGDPPPLVPPDITPAEFAGPVRREFETTMIDQYNEMKPRLTANPALHRMVFQDWMAQATAVDEPQADEIRVHNEVDGEGGAPPMEFQYGNEMLYHRDVPDPEIGTGCGCEGPCNPASRTCRCVKRQQLYAYETQVTGFAYDEEGKIRNISIPVWECGPNCGCPPSCMNRVIQRGRTAETRIDLFKTRQKGWGIRARVAIPKGTFLGVYSGELITDYESERRGHLYTQIGRTYLFDCDGWQIRNPPDLDKLRKVDPRLAGLAAKSVERFNAFARWADDDEMDYYSAYSVDAFHFGFTRYFNHSCDPNLAITQAYVYDYHPERPKLVIFTRRDVVANEELCISYMGISDDADEEEIESPVKGKSKKSKTSATVHPTGKVKRTAANACKCGARNCKGTMFALETLR